MGKGLVVSTIFPLIFIVPETLINPNNASKISVFPEPFIPSNAIIDCSET